MFRENRGKSLSKGLVGIFIVALWMLPGAPAEGGQSATLAWDASPASEVAGYVLYYGTESLAYTNHIDAGTNTHLSVAELKEGMTYYFAVTAYNAAKVESAPSGEIIYYVPGILTIKAGAFPGDGMN